ncbi:MAG: phosphoadenylyl-sulfate reductase [Myxococcota bacterium]
MQDFSTHLAPIAEKLAQYRADGRRLFATTSCQSNSVVLLHVLSALAPDVPVYFMNTGFHFPETLRFKRQLAKQLGLRIIDLFSETTRLQQSAGGRFLFTSDPDHCCHINKIQPLEPVLKTHDVWINGIRAGQSAVRRAMKIEQPAQHGILRYHPLLRWDQDLVDEYIAAHALPAHPLADRGYRSVGCRPCTRAPSPDDDERAGRWVGLKKTECGLHTTLGGGS